MRYYDASPLRGVYFLIYSSLKLGKGEASCYREWLANAISEMLRPYVGFTF